MITYYGDDRITCTIKAKRMKYKVQRRNNGQARKLIAMHPIYTVFKEKNLRIAHFLRIFFLSVGI